MECLTQFYQRNYCFDLQGLLEFWKLGVYLKGFATSCNILNTFIGDISDAKYA